MPVRTGYKEVIVAWSHMMARCYNPKNKDYPNYGGRGIAVAQEWQNSTNFLNDMKPGWKPKLTLNRIDNNKNYSKKNCNWATRLEQNNNTRKNRFIEYNGITKSLSEWARELGIKRSTLDMRIRQYNWTIEKAFERRLI